MTPQKSRRRSFFRVLRRSYLLILLLPLLPASRCFAAVQDLLKLREQNIDVGLTALTLAKEIYPDTDIVACSAKIDDLASQVRSLAKGTKDPNRRVRCLNTVLFLGEKFEASRDNSLARKPENYFLNHLLASKQGNCFSMPLLYVAVAQRLGWPVYLVHVPDHSFARYIDPAFKQQNIEATSGGGYVSDDQYARDFSVSERGRRKGAYLRTLTYRELLGDLVAVNAVAFSQRGQTDKVIAYLKVATQLNPRFVDAWASLASTYRALARRRNGHESEKYRALAARCSKKLGELGFVDPKDVPLFSSTGRPI